MKHRTLGIIFIAATLARERTATPEGAAGRPSVSGRRSAQPGVHSRGATGRCRVIPTAARAVRAKGKSRGQLEPQPRGLSEYGSTARQRGPTIGQKKCDVTTRPSAVESATHAVNPSDTNYGGLLSQWHQQLVHDLLLSVEFWGLMCALGAILLLLLYVLWLMRQRDQRLRVTVDIVLQLTNSRNFARFTTCESSRFITSL